MIYVGGMQVRTGRSEAGTIAARRSRCRWMLLWARSEMDARFCIGGWGGGGGKGRALGGCGKARD